MKYEKSSNHHNLVLAQYLGDPILSQIVFEFGLRLVWESLLEGSEP